MARGYVKITCDAVYDPDDFEDKEEIEQAVINGLQHEGMHVDVKTLDVRSA